MTLFIHNERNYVKINIFPHLKKNLTTMQTNETTSPDLITTYEPTLIRADAGKRFLNYIIDIVVFYILIFLIAILVAMIAPEALESFVEEDSSGDAAIGERLISLLLYGIYMGIIETIFKGKSIGKFITRTRAVNLDGSRISAGTAFGRGLSRAVPFAAFSAFGSPCNPWQDKWTNSMVIDEKQSDAV
ncbi:MAG: RDD family protein [Chitinophagaceae bacterium]|nr:MAG: RDD family protein [Chitinophagaceae bacterium]